METETEEQLLLKCLETAEQAGVPAEQAEALMTRGYVPLPWQWQFHAASREADRRCEVHTRNPSVKIDGGCSCGPVEITCGGARGPGKSHATFAQVALDDCQREVGLKVLFLRKTAISAKESFDDLIERVIAGKLDFVRANNTITFPGMKSRILFGGFHNEDDIDKYVGIEYDVIVVEEMNQLSEGKIEKLKGSLRTSKPNWRPRLYGSFNPGGIGHAFVKVRYVLPHRLMEEKTTRFIPATYKLNPYLNAEYIGYLEGLTGDLGRAWREGDFDLFAGQFFSEWRYEIHTCQPFEIPSDWKRFKSGDAGFVQPSIGWYAISPDGQVFRYRELYKQNLTFSQLAEESVAITNPNEVIDYEVWDPAFWARKGENDQALSGAEIYAQRIKQLTKKEPRMIRGENNRSVGWGIVREYMKPYLGENDVVTSKFQIFTNNTEAIRVIPEQQHDDRNPEDLDTDGEDHIPDEIRYALMSRPKPSMTASQKEDLLFRAAMARKHKKLGTKPSKTGMGTTKPKRLFLK